MRLLIIIFLTSALSCSEHIPKTYTDVTGTWIFQTDSLSCEFTVEAYPDTYIIQKGNASYTFLGQSHTTTRESGFNVNGVGGITDFRLYEGDYELLELRVVRYSTDYTEITIRDYWIHSGGVNLTNRYKGIVAVRK